ncbi:synaptonemal complex central element protein 3 isoform X2 [Morone saxatilis]|nr:synaptonemal complex central element protein 3 isoform X2 [Morone saxatilis]
MADSPPRQELPQNNNDDDELELNKDLERIIENVENISVQLTWMAYDMVALRTSPELGASMRQLEEAYRRCRAVVCGDQDQEPRMSQSPDPAATTLTQM